MATEIRDVDVDELLNRWGEAPAEKALKEPTFWRSQSAVDALLHVHGFERGTGSSYVSNGLPDGALLYFREEDRRFKAASTEPSDHTQGDPARGERIAVEFDERGHVTWKHVALDELSAAETPAFHQLRDAPKTLEVFLEANGRRGPGSFGADLGVTAAFAKTLEAAGYERGGWFDGKPMAVRYVQRTGGEYANARDYDTAERIVWTLGKNGLEWKELAPDEYDQIRFASSLRYEELAAPARDAAAFDRREDLHMSPEDRKQLNLARERAVASSPELLHGFMTSLGLTHDVGDPSERLADGTAVFRTLACEAGTLRADFSGSFVAVAATKSGLSFKDVSFSFAHQTFAEVEERARPLTELVVEFHWRLGGFLRDRGLEGGQEELRPGERPVDAVAKRVGPIAGLLSVARLHPPDVGDPLAVPSGGGAAAHDKVVRRLSGGDLPLLPPPLDAALAQPAKLDAFLHAQGFRRYFSMDDGARVYDPQPKLFDRTLEFREGRPEYLAVQVTDGRLAFKRMTGKEFEACLTGDKANFGSLEGPARGLHEFLFEQGLPGGRAHLDEVLAWVHRADSLPLLRGIADRVAHGGLGPGSQLGQLEAFARSIQRQGYTPWPPLHDGSRVAARPGPLGGDGTEEIILYRVSPYTGEVEWKMPHYHRDNGFRLEDGGSRTTCFEEFTVPPRDLAQMWDRERSAAGPEKLTRKDSPNVAGGAAGDAARPVPVKEQLLRPAPALSGQPTSRTSAHDGCKKAVAPPRECVIGKVLWKPTAERTKSGDLYARVFVRDDSGNQVAAVFWGDRAPLCQRE